MNSIRANKDANGEILCAICDHVIEDYQAPSAQHVIPVRALRTRRFKKMCIALGVDEETINTYVSKPEKEQLELLGKAVNAPQNMTVTHRICNQEADNPHRYDPLEAEWENLKLEHRDRLVKKGKEFTKWVSNTENENHILLRINSMPLDILYAAEPHLTRLRVEALINSDDTHEDPRLSKLTKALDKMQDRFDLYNRNANERVR